MSPPAVKNSLAGNLLLFFVALLLALLAGEGAIRWAIPDAQSHALRGVMRENPLSFIPGSHSEYNSGEYHVTFDINRFGRRDKEWTPTELQNHSNVFFIGDSMVLGYGLSEKESIPGQMESILNGKGKTVEVFNYGMGGAVSLPEYKKLLLSGLQAGIQADAVLVGIFVGNDFLPDEAVVPPFFLDRYSALYRWVKRQAAASPFFVSSLLRFGNKTGLDLYQSPESSIFLKEMPEAQKVFFEKTLAELEKIQMICQKEHRKLRVLIFPTKLQVENASELQNNRYSFDAPNRKISDYCKLHHIEVLDLLPILKSAYESNHEALFFPVDRHFNPKGAHIVAEKIIEELGE